MAKNQYADDEMLYKGFDMACPYIKPVRQNIRPIDAPVRCKVKEKHCLSCGWNPDVKRERLTKMVGLMEANQLMEQSDKLTEITLQEIAKGGLRYDV